MELPEHIVNLISHFGNWKTKSGIEWHWSPYSAQLDLYQYITSMTDHETSRVLRPLHEDVLQWAIQGGHSVVILNGAQLTADTVYPKASNCCHLYKNCISIIDINTGNTDREGCYLLPQSTRDPITVIMVISVGRTLMTAPAGSSECHLIKAMILFLP